MQPLAELNRGWVNKTLSPIEPGGENMSSIPAVRREFYTKHGSPMHYVLSRLRIPPGPLRSTFSNGYRSTRTEPSLSGLRLLPLHKNRLLPLLNEEWMLRP